MEKVDIKSTIEDIIIFVIMGGIMSVPAVLGLWFIIESFLNKV